MGLFETIQNVTQDTLNSQPSALLGKVIAFYGTTATVETSEGAFENIKCVSVPSEGSGCVLLPVGDEYICIPFEMAGGGSDIVTSWETTLSDTKVPSEKLVKNTMDNYIGDINNYIGE